MKFFRKKKLAAPNGSDLIVSSRRLLLPAAIGTAALLSARARAQNVSPPGVSLGTTSATALPGNYGGIDDPTNASGLGAPAIIRGTVYAAQAAGVTVGAGQTTLVRQATAAGLQNAINYAAENNKFFEIEPGTYEINSSTGLVTPATYQFVWKGSRLGTIISQFYTGGEGAPILSVGDSSTFFYGSEIDGATLLYGAAQTGLTNANALVINNLAWSSIRNININQASGNPPYNSIYIVTGCFSCTFSDIATSQAQNNQLYVTAGGTGNVFINLYLNNGGQLGGPYPALAGKYINWNPSGSNEMTFIQLNCEWGSCNQVISLAGGTLGMKIIGLHLEGIELTGFNPIVVGTAYSTLSIDTMDIVDCLFQSGNISGTAQVFADYNSGATSTIEIGTLTWTVNHSGEVNIPVTVNAPDFLPNDYFPNFSIERLLMRDTIGGVLAPRLQFDAHMPVSSSAFQFPNYSGRYEYGPGGSTVNKAEINVSATYTHYGQYKDATIIVPASITSFTLTLAHTMGASGTQEPLSGNTVHVRRESGSASGTLTVADATGGTLTTNTTSATDYYYVFGGVNPASPLATWTTFTPVT